MEAHRILTKEEAQQVLESLRGKCGRGSKNAWVNLAIFHLSAACGLRNKEIHGLDIGDVILDGPHPRVVVRPEIAKGKKVRPRIVPLSWNSATKSDLAKYLAEVRPYGSNAVIVKVARGVASGACSPSGTTAGDRLSRRAIQKRWTTALQVLGPTRAKEVTLHCGRHSFASHALAVGHTLAEIQACLGHSNIKTTSIYTHAVPVECPDLY